MTTTQRPQHAKPRRAPRIANAVYLVSPTGRELRLNADERAFVTALLTKGYTFGRKPQYERE